MSDGREQWIEAGWKALIAGGVRAVRVEAIAREIGVTKGSFYHHFAGRQALLDAMLEGWRARGTDAVITLADRGDSPLERFERLHSIIFESPEGDVVESAVRAWATTDTRAREATERVDQARLEYVAGLLSEAGMEERAARRRTTLYYRMVIGDAIWRTAGGSRLTDEERAELLAMFTEGLTS